MAFNTLNICSQSASVRGTGSCIARYLLPNNGICKTRCSRALAVPSLARLCCCMDWLPSRANGTSKTSTFPACFVVSSSASVGSPVMLSDSSSFANYMVFRSTLIKASAPTSEKPRDRSTYRSVASEGRVPSYSSHNPRMAEGSSAASLMALCLSGESGRSSMIILKARSLNFACLAAPLP